MRGNSIVAAINAAICGWASAPFPASSRGRAPRCVGSRRACSAAANIFLVVHPNLARVARVRAVMDFVVALFTRDAELSERRPATGESGRNRLTA